MTAIDLPAGFPGAAGPYAPRHPARAYRNANFALPATANTVVQVQFNATSYDPEGLFNAAGNYTCPEAGYYAVFLSVSLNILAGAPGTSSPRIYLNGVQDALTIGYMGVQSALIQPVTDLVLCAAGDTLGAYISCSVASVQCRSGTSETYMAVHYVGT